LNITEEQLSNFIDLTGRTINGLKVVQRVSLSATRDVKWSTECIRCGAKKNFPHAMLIHAMSTSLGNVAQCDLTNCRLRGEVKRPIPPTERPIHEAFDETPVAVKPESPVSKPKSKAKAHPLQQDYERVCIARAHYGSQHIEFSDFALIEELRPDFYKLLMNEVKVYEAERYGEELQREYDRDFRQRYGIGG
jgi:hypothetical protein